MKIDIQGNILDFNKETMEFYTKYSAIFIPFFQKRDVIFRSIGPYTGESEMFESEFESYVNQLLSQSLLTDSELKNIRSNYEKVDFAGIDRHMRSKQSFKNLITHVKIIQKRSLHYFANLQLTNIVLNNHPMNIGETIILNYVDSAGSKVSKKHYAGIHESARLWKGHLRYEDDAEKLDYIVMNALLKDIRWQNHKYDIEVCLI